MSKQQCLGLAAVLLVAAIGGVVYMHGAWDRANELAAHGLWRRVRSELDVYRWIHPSDERAHLLMAEALIKDEFLPASTSTPAALDHLAKISDESALASAARVQEARLSFLILCQPAAAERALIRALQLNPNNADACQLLIKLYEMTGRYQQTADLFWKLYEIAPDENRPAHLRDWYLAQFFPVTVNEALDRQMGFVRVDEIPTRSTESNRYLRYIETEPNELVGPISLARWCQQVGQPESAKILLDDLAQKHPQDVRRADYLGVQAATLFDLGEHDAASRALDSWPDADRGFDYWKLLAIKLEEADDKPEEAVLAYDRALNMWPGPSDWRLRHRKAACLTRLKRIDAAEKERQIANRIERLMESDVHNDLQQALTDLNNPNYVAQLVLFYTELNCPREVEAWQRHLKTLGVK